MCVLMVCFNVLELLLDETAMPRGNEVRTSAERILHAWRCTANDLCSLMSVISVRFSTLTWGWPPSPCLVHWVLQFKSSSFCIPLTPFNPQCVCILVFI